MAIQGFFTGDVKIKDLNGVLKAVNGVVEVATDAGTVTSVGLTVGSTGTDVNVANSPITTSGSITLNLPTASATNRGLLSSADWSTFNSKQNALGYTPANAATTLTINGTTYDLSANRSWSVGTHTGSLTSGYIPKATGATTLTDGLLYDTGSAVLLGTQTAGSGKFMVYSTTADNHYQAVGSAPSFRFADTIVSPSYTGIIGLATATNNFIIGAAAGDMVLANNTTSSVGNFLFGTGATERMRITPTGNVSINNTNNTYRLDVNGTGRFTGQLRLESTITNGTYTYTLPGATGTLALTSQLTSGTVTSVAASITGNAIGITGSPITSSGTLAFAFAGNATQYVRGDGALATLPTSGGGGGASVSYYLNGSINQGTIGGVTYYEMNRTPVIGTGTDFSISSNGYIASFLTDANDPALLNIPAGNFNFETYFEASSGGGTPTFYIELYKYDGTTFTLIASNSTNPKIINSGTSVEAYFTALAVPQTTLTLTDRLAIRIYVTTAGRTITLHTEDSNLCQVITTFTTGLTALNGLTSQVQYFATGTSGSDFNISSATATHTFNLPTASATNRGALSSADWTTFNNKQNALTLTTTGTSGAATLVGATLNIPQYQSVLTNPVTGTGTTNYLPKFTGTSTIGNSQIFDDGTNVGIGTASPSYKLDVNGAGRFTGVLYADNTVRVGNAIIGINLNNLLLSSNTTGGEISFWNGQLANRLMTLNGSGNLSIGNTNDTYKLDVSGTGRFTGQLRLDSTITNGTYTYTLPSATGTIALVGGSGVGTVTSIATTGPITGGTITSTGTIGITQSGAASDGYLSSTDWNTFYNKQAAGSYITALTGEATASGPGSATVTLSTSAVTGKLLTGLNLTGGGSIAATDSILQAFGKVQNQISGLAGGVTFQGTWNASTNTPTLTSSVGTKGYYYIVDVAGSTNLNGITDWKVGDWAIFNGSTWDKVDNTDAVSSVNGFTGAVSLTTSNIAEGTNLYYLDSRARLALSFTAGSGAYNNITGVITIPTNTNQLTNGANYITLSSLSASSPLSYNSGTGAFSISQANTSTNGFLSSTDWNTFNGKQAALNGTGFVKISGTTISYDNSTYYLASNPNAYIALTALSAGAGISYNNTTGVIASTITQYTDANARAAISLTTSGTSGAATYNSTTGVLNVPQYAPDLSGYVPTSRTLTINGTAYDLSANRSWSVGTVTSVGLSSATSGVTIGSTPITTSGTITLAIATASGSQQGLLSSTDWNTFNNKQNALTNPVTGTGTTNYLPKFTGTSTIGNSQVFDDGTNVGIGTTAPTSKLTVLGDAIRYAPVSLASGNAVLVIKDDGSNGTLDIASEIIGDANVLSNPITFRVSNPDRGRFEAMRLDASGNLGLGVTPSAWNTNYKGFEVAGIGQGFMAKSGEANLYINTNAYYNNSGSWIYGYTDYASLYQQFQGQHKWFNAPSGTAGNAISFTQAMTLDASGRLSIGQTSSALQSGGTGITLYGASASEIKFLNSSTGSAATDGTALVNSGLNFTINNREAGDLLFGTSNTTRLTIASTGAATFSSSVTATELYLSTSNGLVGNINSSNANGGYLTWQTSGTTIADIGTATQVFGSGGNDIFGINGRGARAIAFGTNNTERMRITSGGNVGIGTTSPGYKLEVNGNVYGSTTAQFGTGYIDGTQSGWAIFGSNSSSNGIKIVLDGSVLRNDIVVATSGNIGIGTSSPATKLHVVGPISVERIGVNVYSTIDMEGNFRFNASSGYAHTFLNNGSELMRIMPSGNVGIGTTSPAAKLHLSGNFEVDDALRISSTYGTGRTYRFKSQGGNADVLSILESESSNRLAFFGNLEAGLGTNGSTRLYINSSGNVGIGTTSPGDRLDVIGNIALNAGYKFYNGSANNSAGIDFDSSYVSLSGYNGIRFFASNTGVGSMIERLRITSSGNFEIPWANNRVNIMNYDNDYRMGLLYEANARTFTLFSTGSDGGGTIAFRTRGTAATGGSTDYGTERMRITSGGSVLIGTTTEGFLGKLQVAGSVAITGQYNTVLPSSSFSYFDGSGQVVSSSSNASALYLDTTWNTTGNPDGIYLNVTNTASGASSKLLNLKVGSVSQFSVSKGGAIQTSDPTNGTARPWKLGDARSGTISTNYYIIVEVNGQTYSIPALQGLP